MEVIWRGCIEKKIALSLIFNGKHLTLLIVGFALNILDVCRCFDFGQMF